VDYIEKERVSFTFSFATLSEYGRLLDRHCSANITKQYNNIVAGRHAICSCHNHDRADG
jgi:hypothetical protein